MKSRTILAAILHVCASTKLAVKEPPPDPEQVSLPPVPGVKHAGQSGYPELPALESIMSASSKTLSGISSEARQLEAKMLRVQNENALRLKRQKSVFDRKLKDQEEKNQVSVRENANIAKAILETKKLNEQLVQTAKTLKQGNMMRRTVLSKIQAQLSQVQLFLKETEEQSDDSKAPELEILYSKNVHKEAALVSNDAKPLEQKDTSLDLDTSERPKEELPALEEPIEEAEPSEDGLSFLSMESEVAIEPAEEVPLERDVPAGKDAPVDKDASNLIDVLAEGVSDLKVQGQKSEAQLKQLFLADFQGGVKRRKALEAQQRVLKNTLSKMKTYEAKMQAAIRKLEATKNLLDKRLHDGGVFLQKLAQVTLSKPEEAHQALVSMKHDL